MMKVSVALIVGTLACTAGVAFGATLAEGSMVATGLRCEYAVDPLGVDVTTPRFSWCLNTQDRGELQTAYRILVGISRENVDRDVGHLWDSDKVSSGESINVPYAGRQLTTAQACFWKVKVWDKEGREGSWSDVATFEMGLLEPTDWKGSWIGGGNMLRKGTNFGKPIKQARAYISGIGYNELWINGSKVGDAVLNPGWTDFKKRILYDTYDVTRMLNDGANAVGVMLGHGWSQSLQVILQLNVEYADGTTESLVTDGSWKATNGPIVSDSVYDGETYDARLEKRGWAEPGYDDSSWNAAQVVPGPGGKLAAQLQQPIKVTRDIVPVALTNPVPGVYIYDLGQNIAGWARITVRGPRGTQVVMRFAELLYGNGMLDRENLGKAKATDTCILKGDGVEVYEPRFTYHGFRYIEVTGFPGVPTLDDLRGRVVHSAVEPTGSFTCSNPLIDKIQQNILWTQRDNLHSIPTDCPQRSERMGWMGDAHVTAEEALFNYDMARFYTKWLNDIADAQNPETGAVPDTVPRRYGEKLGDPAWATAYVLIPWYMYQQLGDVRILEQHYDGMKKWVDCLTSKAKDHIVEYSYYGDWVSVAESPKNVISAFYYYYDARIVAEVAQLLGKSDDAKKYSDLAHRIKAAFMERFFNPETNQVGNGSQTCNTLGVFLDLVPEDRKSAVLENMVKDITVTREGHLSTGIIGTKYIMEALTNNGRTDVAYQVASQTTYPSWGYMLSRGATTIWELWKYQTGPGMNSHNHPMFGSVGAWFYEALAGINADQAGPGYRRVIIKPHVVGDLTHVSAMVRTVRGVVSSSWTKGKESVILNITIPVNSEAQVYVPKAGLSAKTVAECGTVVWQNGSYVPGVAGITSATDEKEYVKFSVGSGSYSFELR